MIGEYNLVRTLVAKEEFPAGTKGVIVSVYGDGRACEVEVWDDDDYPVDVVTYLASEVEVIDG